MQPTAAIFFASLTLWLGVTRIFGALRQACVTGSPTQEVIARLNAIAPTDVIVPDAPPSGGSCSSSGRLKSSHGGANSARGEADAAATIQLSGAEGGQRGTGGKTGGASVISDTQQVRAARDRVRVLVHARAPLCGHVCP